MLDDEWGWLRFQELYSLNHTVEYRRRLAAYNERIAREKAWHEEYNSWPSVELMRELKESFTEYTEGFLCTSGSRVIFSLDKDCGISPDNRSKHTLLLRYLKVLPEHRGQGLALGLLKCLTFKARLTRCAIYCVCSPFEESIPEGMSEPEAVRKGTYLTLKSDYEDSQKRCRERLRQAGFVNIRLNESDRKERIMNEDIFIYLPANLDEEFRKAISHRLII